MNLQTYSSHLGPVVSPNWEDDVERARTYKEPNFYYTQVRNPQPLFEDSYLQQCELGGYHVEILSRQRHRVGVLSAWSDSRDRPRQCSGQSILLWM